MTGAHNLAHDASITRSEPAPPLPGAFINVDRSLATYPFDVRQPGETNELGDPQSAGIILALVCFAREAGGTREITAESAINVAGNTKVTLDAVGEQATLISIPYGDGYRWSVVSTDGATLS